MKHKVLKMFLINALILAVSVFLVNILTNLIFVTLFNAFFGEAKGVYAANVFMRFCLIAITTVSFCLTILNLLSSSEADISAIPYLWHILSLVTMVAYGLALDGAKYLIKVLKNK